MCASTLWWLFRTSSTFIHTTDPLTLIRAGKSQPMYASTPPEDIETMNVAYEVNANAVETIDSDAATVLDWDGGRSVNGKVAGRHVSDATAVDQSSVDSDLATMQLNSYADANNNAVVHPSVLGVDSHQRARFDSDATVVSESNDANLATAQPSVLVGGGGNLDVHPSVLQSDGGVEGERSLFPSVVVGAVAQGGGRGRGAVGELAVLQPSVIGSVGGGIGDASDDTTDSD